MMRNQTALMILLGVQLLVWKGMPTIISHTPQKSYPSQQQSNQSDIQTTLKGHALKVSSALITTDNKTVISGSEDNTIKIWNSITGQLERTLTGHTGVIDYLSVTPDGKYIVSAESKNIKIWTLQTGTLIRDIRNSDGITNFVQTSQDGKILVIDGGTQTIKNTKITVNKFGYTYPRESITKKYIINVFNLENGTLKNKIVNDSFLTKIEISQSGSFLVSGDKVGKIKIFKLENGTLQKTLIGHESDIKSIAISPDEKTIVSTDQDGKIKIWDVMSGKLKSTFTGHAIPYPNQFVRVLIPDNNTLVSWNTTTSRLYKNDIKIWNLQTGELKYTLNPLKNDNSPLYNTFDFVTVSSDGKNLMTKQNLSIQTWELATGQLKNTTEIQGDILALSPDGKILLTRVDDNNNINIWHLPFSH